MEETIRRIVAKVAETSPDFDASADFRDTLNIDSMRALEILFEIEQTFGITIPQERYAGIRKFSDLLKLTQGLKS